MPMVEINSRWGVQLEGDLHDIDLLEKYLRENFDQIDDYYVQYLQGIVPLRELKFVSPDSGDSGENYEEEHGVEAVPVLRTLKWDRFETVDEVSPVLKEIVRTLSGCLNILNGSASLKIGTIFEFTSPFTFNMTRHTQLQMHVRQSQDNLATAKDFGRIVKLVDKHQWLAGCLPLLESAPDWFACYKAIESIEIHVGGEKQMTRSKIFDGQKLKRAKRMANTYRHFGSEKHHPPHPPLDITEARSAIFDAIRSIILTL